MSRIFFFILVMASSFLNGWSQPQNGEDKNIKLLLEIKAGNLYYTFENRSDQNYLFVDFLVNQSYFFSWKIDSTQYNLCDVMAPPIKLDYNELRKKHKVKLRKGHKVRRKLIFPKKSAYHLVVCRPEKLVSLVLVYSPGMFLPEYDSTEKYNFIDFHLYSNPIEVDIDELNE